MLLWIRMEQSLISGTLRAWRIEDPEFIWDKAGPVHVQVKIFSVGSNKRTILRWSHVSAEAEQDSNFWGVGTPFLMSISEEIGSFHLIRTIVMSLSVRWEVVQWELTEAWRLCMQWITYWEGYMHELLQRKQVQILQGSLCVPVQGKPLQPTWTNQGWRGVINEKIQGKEHNIILFYGFLRLKMVI